MFDIGKKNPIRCTNIRVLPTDAYPFKDTHIQTNLPVKVVPNESRDSKLSKMWVFRTYKLSLWNSKIENKGNDESLSMSSETKLSNKRFWMLFLFCVCSMLNAFQWIQYSIISNIIECYHGVDAYAVNWTSTIYMITYVVLVLPVSWFMDKFDSRVTLLTGSFLSCLSAFIQCLSVKPDGFPIALGSQAVAAIAQVFILPIPPRLAAVWFGSKEVGRATAVGVLGNQFGAAIGFLIPPMVVTNDCSNPDLIKYGRSVLAYTLTGFNLLNFLLLLTTFKNKPPVPANDNHKELEKTEYKKTLSNLARNSSFLTLLLIYGLMTGVSMALGTLLNQMLAPLFQDSEKQIGWIGISTNLFGLISAFFAGYVLDSTQKFKATSLAICILGLFSMILMTGLLHIREIWVPFLTVNLTGFFLNSYFPVGIDFATEITYPQPEGTTAGIMNASTMIFGTVITMIASYLLQSYSVVAACLCYCGVIITATIINAIMKPQLKRSERNKGP